MPVVVGVKERVVSTQPDTALVPAVTIARAVAALSDEPNIAIVAVPVPAACAVKLYCVFAVRLTLNWLPSASSMPVVAVALRARVAVPASGQEIAPPLLARPAARM